MPVAKLSATRSEIHVNVAWLMRPSTLGWALGISGALSVLILLFSPEGLPALRKREKEILVLKQDLIQKSKANQELADEVHRLADKDPELMEALCRRQGYARPGETVFTFRGNGSHR